MVAGGVWFEQGEEDLVSNKHSSHCWRRYTGLGFEISKIYSLNLELSYHECFCGQLPGSFTLRSGVKISGYFVISPHIARKKNCYVSTQSITSSTKPDTLRQCIYTILSMFQ